MNNRIINALFVAAFVAFTHHVRAATNQPVNCNCVANLPVLVVSNCPAYMPDLCSLATNCFSTNVIIGAPNYCLQVPPPGIPANAGTNIIMFTVMDSQSNFVTCPVQFIVVQPPNPTLTLICPSNKTVECGSGWAFNPPVIVTTCCDAALALNIVSTKTNGNCPKNITRTWDVINNCGLTATCTQMVTVVDSLSPTTLCSGVNFVPNWNFESYSGCPTSSSQFDLAAPWFTPTAATSDYYNSCSGPGSYVGVPTNSPGVQASLSGQGYGGIFTWSTFGTHATNSYREYMEVPLFWPLAAGQTYSVSFYVNRGDFAGNAMAEIGAHFSAGPVTNYGGVGNGYWGVLPVVPQVVNPSGNILLSTNSWMLISGTFVAAGGEDHLTIGNFLSDPATTAVPASGNFINYSYYYVEDVVVQAVCPPSVTNKFAVCGMPLLFDAPTFFDQCSGTNVAVTVNTVTNGSCPKNITRTWTGTDLCGNSNAWSQTITVVDTNPPVLLCNGLNLVPNPGFDNSMTCPSNFSQLDLAYPWNRASDASPDYFKSCATGLIGVPTNYFGDQSPFNGQGYAGVYVYNPTGETNPLACYREYIQVQLLSPLVAGQTYPVSFRVSPGDYCGWAIAEMGAHFSVGSISNGIVGVLNAVPQVVNPSTNLLTATNAWTLISGAYTAFGGETHLTIGCFLTDAATTATPILVNATNQANLLADVGYYYIDDVYVGAPCGIAPLVIVPCGTPVTFPTVTGFDDCSGNVTVAINTVTNLICPLSITRTWTLTDLCGNSTNLSQTVSNIVDNTPPLPLCGAMNLVANPGFEFYTNCPGDVSQLAFAPPWYQPTFATPDFFNTCASSNIVTVPANFQGSQTPFEGQAYAGLVAYSLNNDYREYLQAPLVTPLVAGQTYIVSYRVSLADSSGWAASELGAYFSTGPVVNYGIQSPLPVVPQIENAAGNPLTSATGWMLVQGTYVAAGGENFLTIGNFRADNATTVVPAAGNETSVAYYYIDAVQIQTPCNMLTNVVLPCGTPIVFPDVTGYDLCSGTNITTVINNVTNSLCPLNITRSWTFTDACGNSTNISQTMGALADTEPPMPICIGTNLVPNPSFETFTNCPYNYSQLDYAVPWYSPGSGTSDYFNTCDPMWIPVNIFGSQYPFNGQAYAGAYLRYQVLEYREYLQTPLTMPMVAGQTYTVSFRVSLAEISDVAISQIGAHFSVNPVTSTNYFPLNVVPQVLNNVTNFITNTNGWTLIAGNYTAVGGEAWLTLGNFLSNNVTAFTNVSGGPAEFSYYYFDDVRVIPATACPPQEILAPCGQPLPFTPVTAYDNCSGTNITTTITDTTNSTCPLIVTRSWTFTDLCGNSTNVSQQVFATDSQPPVVNCACLLSNAQPLLFTNACHGVIPDLAFLTNCGCATDNCGPVQFFQSPPAGTVVNPGSHPITLTFFDCYGNSTNCAVTYNVLSPPVAVFTPPDIFVLTCSNSAVVNFNLNYFGIFGVITCTPPSGSSFPLGTNVVTCVGTTSCGDPFTNTFKVIVQSARVTRWSCMTFIIGIPYEIIKYGGGSGSGSAARMVNIPDFPGGGMGADFENFATDGQDGPRFNFGAADKFTFSTELDFNAADGAGFDFVVPPGASETSGTPLLRFRRSCDVHCGWDVTRPLSIGEPASALYRSIAIGTNGELFSSFTQNATALNTNVLLNLAPMNGATSVVMTVTLDCRTREVTLDFPFCNWTPDAARKGWDGCIYGNGPRGGVKTNKTARFILTPLTTVLPAPITNLDLIVTNLSVIHFDNPSLNSMGRKWGDGHVTLMKAYDDGAERALDFTSLGQGGGVKADLGHAATVSFRTHHFETGDVPTQEQFYNLIDSRLFTNSIRFTQTVGGIGCAADFTQWGISNVSVQLWNGTALVAETNHVPATLASSLVNLGSFPGIFSCSGNGVVSLSDTNPIIVLSGLNCGSSGCVGTELRIVPELSGPGALPSAFTGLECLISDGMDLRLSQLQTTPACAPAPIDASRNSAGLHLNWSGDGFRLQGAETLLGPWYDLGVSPPVTLPVNSSLRLFRLRCD